MCSAESKETSQLKYSEKNTGCPPNAGFKRQYEVYFFIKVD